MLIPPRSRTLPSLSGSAREGLQLRRLSISVSLRCGKGEGGRSSLMAIGRALMTSDHHQAVRASHGTALEVKAVVSTLPTSTMVGMKVWYAYDEWQPKGKYNGYGWGGKGSKGKGDGSKGKGYKGVSKGKSYQGDGSKGQGQDISRLFACFQRVCCCICKRRRCGARRHVFSKGSELQGLQEAHDSERVRGL